MDSLRWDLDLLTSENAKTSKGEALGWRTLILYMTPGQYCPNASAGCLAACLNTAGRGAFQSVQDGRAMRSAKFAADRARFIARLDFEIGRGLTRARREGINLAVRLNGTTDLPWERLAPELFTKWTARGVVFYDYSKDALRAADGPYNLTFSRAEHNDAQARALVARGVNVAVVFNTARGAALPATWAGAPVIDGDTHDLRFLDPVGVVVGLRAKGKARQDASGFVVRA